MCWENIWSSDQYMTPYWLIHYPITNNKIQMRIFWVWYGPLFVCVYLYLLWTNTDAIKNLAIDLPIIRLYFHSWTTSKLKWISNHQHFQPLADSSSLSSLSSLHLHGKCKTNWRHTQKFKTNVEIKIFFTTTDKGFTSIMIE